MVNFIKKRWWIFLIFLIFIFVVLRFFYFDGEKKDKSQNKYRVNRKNLKEELTLSGEIDAEEKVTLRFQTSGRLAWVGIKEGDFVKKYQTVASLDQRDLKNRLQKYLNIYMSQRYDFEQIKDDNWQKQFDLSESIRTKAERILKQNQLNLERTVLDVEYQNLSIEYANLFTPIEGIVTKVNVPYPGVNITPAQAEFEIVNPKTLFFSATADQTEVINLKEGLKGTIILDSFAEEELEGEIYWIAFTPKLGETGTVYQLKIKFNNQNKNFRLGMNGDINFVIKERENVLAVPINYLKSDKKGDYVNLVINGKTSKKYIKKGEQIDDQIIIKDGLRENDIIEN